MRAVSLASRPFGMTPEKDGLPGYRVARVNPTDKSKSAVAAGVKACWHLTEINGEDCSKDTMEQVPALLQASQI